MKENTYDFTEAAKWLDCYSAKEMADTLKDESLNLVNIGLEKDDSVDPKERVLRMQEAVNFVCGFLGTIKVKGALP